MYIKQSVKLLMGCVFLGATCVSAGTTVNLIANSGFDSSSVSLGSYQYQNHDDFWSAAWLFTDDSSGIANSNSAWGGEAATNSVAFLQNGGGVSQFISSEAHYFTISFDLAQRGGFDTGYVDVYFNNDLIAENISPSSSVFQSYEYKVIGYARSLHSLAFQGVDNDGDATVFLDNVVVTGEY